MTDKVLVCRLNAVESALYDVNFWTDELDAAKVFSERWHECMRELGKAGARLYNSANTFTNVRFVVESGS